MATMTNSDGGSAGETTAIAGSSSQQQRLAPSRAPGADAGVVRAGVQITGPESSTVESEAQEQERDLVVVVTGRAGAGRSTAMNKLEDLGFETVDTPPMSFIPDIARAQKSPRRLAIGVDLRTSGFSPEAFAATADTLRSMTTFQTVVLFLDSSDQTLLRRYTETRRRHPLARSAAIAERASRWIANARRP